jgi:hypothetical protein
MKCFQIIIGLVLLVSSCSSPVNKVNQQWSIQRANEWYANEEWPVGTNFTPSTAINTIEMWDAETYDSATIDRELGWAQEIGFNTQRVNFHYLVWARNPETFKRRVENFLNICEKHKQKIMFVFFDDCWNKNPTLGKQPEPIPGVHNSGWVQCPGGAVQNADTSLWLVLEAFQKDVMYRFRNDKRIICWDLYNEPGNSDYLNLSLPLLKKSFEWAREINPSQPVTAGMWNFSDNFKDLNKFCAENSDIITFHNYENASELESMIALLKKYKRPMICTEYMARGRDSKFQSHLPIFKKDKIGALNWGFVAGKTQTKYPWGSPVGAPEPNPWHHDVLHLDGTPYDSLEVKFIKEIMR